MAPTYGTVRATGEQEVAADHWVRWPVAGLELFVALGGVFGGFSMLQNPRDAMGMTAGMLDGSPFSTFTWPGVILLVLNGLLPGLLAVGVLLRRPYALGLSVAYGCGLMAWIAVEWIMLDGRLWLQPVIFAIGGVIAATSAVGLRAQLR